MKNLKKWIVRLSKKQEKELVTLLNKPQLPGEIIRIKEIDEIQ